MAVMQDNTTCVWDKTMKNTKIKLGEQIKKFRILRGMTQNDLAEKVGLTEKQISKIETGIHYPMFENFVKIMEVLGVGMKDFDNDLNIENNILRNSILKILYRANDYELKYYSIMIKQLEKLFKEQKNN